MVDIHAIRAPAYRVAVEGDDFRFADSNAACLALSGITNAFQHGLTPHDVFPPDVAASLVEKYRACCAGEAVSYVCNLSAGGAPRSWRTTLFSIAGPNGHPGSLYGICSPLDEVELGDRSDPMMSDLALEALDGGFWTFDLATRAFQTSRGLAEKVAGPGHASLDLAEYVGFIHVDDLSLPLSDDEDEITVEFRIFTYQKRQRWFRTRRRTVRDATGRATHVVGIVLDITEAKLTMMRLEREAATDRLTSVGNRRAFDEAAERYFGNEADGCFGVVLVDLDGFKPINDRYGHLAGDDLLREAGRRLTELVPPDGLLARVGGDEFAVLLPKTTSEQMHALTARIEAVFREPFDAQNTMLRVGASCGCALRSGADRSVGDIVARADRALYAAKASRRLTA